MVLFFESEAATQAGATIFMGIDKHENEVLLRYGIESDVWFHVDKLSSAHLYLRLPASITWEAIPAPLLADCAQLVKAHSIEGNKKQNLTVIYTSWSNVKKTGDMATGAVSFHNDRKVKRTHVEKDQAAANKLIRTKKERVIDHEQERQNRLRDEGKAKKAKAIEEKKATLALMKKRQEEAEARDYSKLFTPEAMEEAKRQKEKEKSKPVAAAQDEDEDDGMDSDDSFM